MVSRDKDINSNKLMIKERNDSTIIQYLIVYKTILRSKKIIIFIKNK